MVTWSRGLGLENRVYSVESTVPNGFFPYLVQMITSMRRCVACDDLWPWPISSRSLDLVLTWVPAWLSSVGNHENAGVLVVLVELGISIIEISISMTILWMSIFNYGCPPLNFRYPLLRITTMDSHYGHLKLNDGCQWLEYVFVSGSPYSTHLPMPRIYWCFIHFIPHPQRSWRGVHWVHLARLSICPSMGRIVSAVYHPQYKLHPFRIYRSYQPTSEGVLRAEFCDKF